MIRWHPVEFEGTIEKGQFLCPDPNIREIHFTGHGITTNGPCSTEIDPRGDIFKVISNHFRISPPYTITLRCWSSVYIKRLPRIEQTWTLP